MRGTRSLKIGKPWGFFGCKKCVDTTTGGCDERVLLNRRPPAWGNRAVRGPSERYLGVKPGRSTRGAEDCAD